MKTKTLFALLLLITAPLFAEPIKLKVVDVISLNQALSLLDGAQKVVPQGDAPAKIVIVPYDFSGKTRWAIAQNLIALQPHAKAADDARNALVKQIGGEAGGIKADDAAKIAKFTVAYNELLIQPVTVELTKIPLADLKLDINALPPSVLAILSPIIIP
jgi:hypothetical protein